MFDIERISISPKHRDKLRDYISVRSSGRRQQDRGKSGIHGLQRHLLLLSGWPRKRTAVAALDGVALTALWIDGVTGLYQDGFALSGPFDRRSEQAISAVGDHGLHGLSDDLRDEHPTAERRRSAIC